MYALTSQVACLPIISVNEALTIISSTLTENKILLETETVNTKNAFGRRLLEAAICRSNVPSFSVATKQGYAIKVERETKEIKDTSDEVSCNTNLICNKLKV